MAEILPFVLPKDRQPPHPEYGLFLKQLDFEGSSSIDLYEKGLTLNDTFFPFDKCIEVTHSTRLYFVNNFVDRYEFRYKDMDKKGFDLEMVIDSISSALDGDRQIRKTIMDQQNKVYQIITQMAHARFLSTLFDNNDKKEE